MDTIVQTIAVHEHALGTLNHVRGRLIKKKEAAANTAAIDELLAANQRALQAIQKTLAAAFALRAVEEKRLRRRA
jgi:hypothetical protein